MQNFYVYLKTFQDLRSLSARFNGSLLDRNAFNSEHAQIMIFFLCANIWRGAAVEIKPPVRINEHFVNTRSHKLRGGRPSLPANSFLLLTKTFLFLAPHSWFSFRRPSTFGTRLGNSSAKGACQTQLPLRFIPLAQVALPLILIPILRYRRE